MTKKAEKIEAYGLRQRGLTLHEVAERLNVSRRSVARWTDDALKTLPIEEQKRQRSHNDKRRTRRYDWNKIQEYYDSCQSSRKTAGHFGLALWSLQKAAKRGDLIMRAPNKLTIEQLLVAGVGRNRWEVRRRLIAEGILEDKCAICDLKEWKGRPLSLDLDHMNGDRKDWRLENLRLLCPNCHRQTETFGIRNRKH